METRHTVSTVMNVLVLIAAGFGFLFLRNYLPARKRRRLAAERGLQYSARGLEEIPVELQQTVLFTIADGCHERDVVSGTLTIAEESVRFWSFEMSFQRDIRGEWAYVTTNPAFRLHSPATVLVYELDRHFAQLVAKRRGPADIVSGEMNKLYKSVASVAREASGIDRAIALDAFSQPCAANKCGMNPIGDSACRSP